MTGLGTLQGRQPTGASLLNEADLATAVLDTAAALIVVLDLEGRFLRINRACEQFSGYSQEEIAARRFWELVHPPEEANRLKAYFTAPNGPALPFTYEDYWPLRDGRRRLISWVVSLHADATGQPDFIIAVGTDVTEARQREAALRESEERYHSLFEHSVDAVLLTSPDGNVLAANPEACRIFGRSEPEICRIGRDGLVDLTDPRLPELLAQRERAGKAHGELRFRRADGSLFPGGITSAIFVDANGQPKTSMIIRDITQRKAAEEALRLSEERFRRAFEEAPVGMALVAPAGRWLKVNAALCAILGYSEQELLAADYQSLTHPADLESSIAYGRQLLAGEIDSYQSEKRYLHKQGQIAWAQLSVSLIRDGAGAPLYFLAQIQDITARKRAEEVQRLLVEAGIALASSIDYATTLENVARLAVGPLADYCIIDIRDDDGQVHRVAGAHVDPAREPLLRTLLRYPPDLHTTALLSRVITTGEPALLIDIPESLLLANSVDAEHMAAMRALAPHSVMVVPLLTREGARGAISLMAAAPGRRYSGADLSLALDLARRAGLALENARLYRQAREAIASRDALLSVVSHDIRNHLVVVGTFASLLAGCVPAEDSREAGQLHEGLGHIKAAANQMDYLVQDLMDFARLRGGHLLALDRQPTDLVALARQVITQQQSTTTRHQITFQTGAEHLTGLWDRNRLARVLANLLTNAIKFSPRGGPIVVSVDRAPDGAGGWAVLTVQDQGVGIPDADLPGVFTQFARGTNAGNTKGAGIGLFSVQQIVKLHGGSVEVASREGAGSTFTVRLPSSSETGAA